MQIHISRGGQEIGEYSLDEANRLLNEGALQLDDQAWTPGQSDWGALSGITGVVRPNIPPPQMSAPSIQARSKYAVASLVCGVLCIVPGLNILTFIPALVLGQKTLKDVKEHPGMRGKGFGLTGTIFGCLILALFAFAALSAAFSK